MSFEKDTNLIEEAGEVYGRYITTFQSDTGQVRADLFDEDGILIAHVSFSPGTSAASVTDSYMGHLNDFAKMQGFAGKLRIVYAE